MSALAITGITLTFLSNSFIHTRSRDLMLWREGRGGEGRGERGGEGRGERGGEGDQSYPVRPPPLPHCLRVPSGGDEVEAGMDTGVVEVDQVSLDLQLLLEVRLKLPVDVVHDGRAAVLLVDLVTKAGRAHHGQTQLHVALLEVYVRTYIVGTSFSVK